MKLFEKRQAVAGAAIIALMIGYVAYRICREFDAAKVYCCIRSADISMLVSAFAAMLIFFVCEGMNIGRGLDLAGCKVPFFHMLKYSAAGFFFSSITPSSSGGQPAQLVLMHRDGIDMHRGILALILELVSFQTSMVLISSVSFALFHSSICRESALLYAAGITLNVSVLAFLAVLVFSEKSRRRIAGIAVFFSGKHRIKTLKWIARYNMSVMLLKGRKTVLLRMIAVSCIQLISLFSVTYIVYHALGMSGEEYFLLTGLQSIVFASVSALPLPGGAGAAEGGFALMFYDVFPADSMGAAIILTRIMTFIVPVLFTGTVLGLSPVCRRFHTVRV